MSTNANAVVDPGVAVAIMVVMSHRVGVDVGVLVGAEEVLGLEAETMEEVVTSEGRTLGGVGGVDGAVVLRRRRRRLGHLGGGIPRLTGGDRLFVLETFVTQCFIYAYMLSFAELALDHS